MAYDLDIGWVKFQTFFEPKTLAVIGISLDNDRHPANVIYNKNRLRYPVKVFPVNNKGGRYQGEDVYASVLEVPERVELAIIAVRAQHVPGVLTECIEAEVGGAIIISGGFAEVGRRDLQDYIKDLAKEAAFPFMGPNCIGIFSPSHLDTFFIPSERMVMPVPGNVAIVSQSGGILADLMVKFAGEGVGLSRAVSIGNKAMIGELDLVKILAKDRQTKVIAFYIEGFGENEGRGFVLAAEKSPKPVIVLKAGKSPGGTTAVSSHTASIAGDYKTFSKALFQFGVVEARNELELVSFCESLSCYGTSIQGNMGIITGSGGHGALAVDICAGHGLEVPGLSEGVQERMREMLSPSIRAITSLKNPIDLTGSAQDDDFVVAVEALAKTPEIDCIIVLLLPYLPGISSDLGARLSLLYLLWGKPLIAYVPHVEKYRMLVEGFELNGVPVSHSIEGAVLMAEGMRRLRPC